MSRPILNSMVPVAMSSPAVNNKESPGRKKPMSNPVSAKIITHMIKTTHGPNPGFPRITAGSNHGGNRPAETPAWMDDKDRRLPVSVITTPA